MYLLPLCPIYKHHITVSGLQIPSDLTTTKALYSTSRVNRTHLQRSRGYGSSVLVVCVFVPRLQSCDGKCLFNFSFRYSPCGQHEFIPYRTHKVFVLCRDRNANGVHFSYPTGPVHHSFPRTSLLFCRTASLTQKILAFHHNQAVVSPGFHPSSSTVTLTTTPLLSRK